MENEKTIGQIRELWRFPEPEGKKEFFQKLEEQGFPERRPVIMSHGEFLAGQLCYIEKWIWILSGILLFFITWISSRNAGNYPFALTPLLAAGILAETGRSFRRKMTELEHAARFSLRSVVLARMFLVGAVDTAGLLVIMPVVRLYRPYSGIRVFLYMMVPYLTASLLGSIYERKRRTGAGYGSLLICLLSSALFAAVPHFYRQMYGESLTVIWAAAFFLTACGLAVSVREYLHEMEGPVWN